MDVLRLDEAKLDLGYSYAFLLGLDDKVFIKTDAFIVDKLRIFFCSELFVKHAVNVFYDDKVFEVLRCLSNRFDH